MDRESHTSPSTMSTLRPARLLGAVDGRTNARTECPADSSARTIAEPTKPLAPVTSTIRCPTRDALVERGPVSLLGEGRWWTLIERSTILKDEVRAQEASIHSSRSGAEITRLIFQGADGRGTGRRERRRPFSDLVACGQQLANLCTPQWGFDPWCADFKGEFKLGNGRYCNRRGSMTSRASSTPGGRTKHWR